MHHNQSSRIDIKTAVNKQQPKKHKYRELLTHLQCCTKAPLSYKEQAEIVGCSERFSKKIAKQNLINQIISITPTTHKSFGRNLKGKNIYGHGKNFDPKIHLINNLNFSIEKNPIINVMFEKNSSQNSSNKSHHPNSKKTVLIRKFVTKDGLDLPLKNRKKFTPNKNYKENLDKSKFAKAKQLEFSKKFITQEQKFEVLKTYGFESYAEKSPIWWFRDLTRLKAALRLLKAKLKRGFKPKNFFNFITFLLKHGTFGYRRHIARNTSLAINRPTIDRIEPFMRSEAIANGYESLKKLHQKHALDISFTNIQKLARKGYAKLFTAAEVMLKRLKIPGIKDVNAFMHHLISMKEPYDILRKNQ